MSASNTPPTVLAMLGQSQLGSQPFYLLCWMVMSNLLDTLFCWTDYLDIFIDPEKAHCVITNSVTVLGIKINEHWKQLKELCNIKYVLCPCYFVQSICQSSLV